MIASLLAALAAVPAATADLRPVRRDYGELTVPLVRSGTVKAPAGNASGRVRVMVTLKQAPLARAQARSFSILGARQKLNVHTASSQSYIARIEAAQAHAVAQLRRAIPSARVSRRYQVVLNALAISLPATQLPKLGRMSFVQRVWPSLTYRLNLNKAPSVIGADVFHQATGANGEGVKIGIVDDGVDNTNPFLAGAGLTPPAGFPLGDTRFTNGKIIVARAFPGPNSGPGGQLALDRDASFHGTHVSGIAAGDAGTCSPGGQDHAPTCGLSGVAPKAWIGNYRVFNVPTPLGNSANSPEIAAAFEAAVRDGMDVINFSGGGPETDPATDVMVPTVANVAAAGVVPVISAGNDRDDFGLGSAGAPGTTPAAITVAAATNTHVFGAVLTARAGGQDVLRAPVSPGRNQIPIGWASSEQVAVDVTSIAGTQGRPVDRFLCAPGNDPNANATELAAGSLGGQIALAYRGHCTFVTKALRAQQAGAVGLLLIDNRPGEANPVPVETAVPTAMLADADGAALKAAMAPTGRVNIRINLGPETFETGRSGVITSFSSAGPTSMDHLLKPDVAAPGGQILSSTLREFTGGSPFAVFDGTSMAAPHVAGAAALLVQRHPTWSTQQVKSALVSTAGPAWADTVRTQEAPVTLAGGGLVNVMAADDPQVFTAPSSLSFGDLNVNGGAREASLLLNVGDAGTGAGNWAVALRPQNQTRGVSITVPPMVAVAPGAAVDVPVVARAAADAEAGDQMGFVVLTKGNVTRRVPYYFAVTRPGLEALQAEELKTVQSGNTRTGPSRVSIYRFPAAPFGPATDYVGPPMNETGSERLFTINVPNGTTNFGAVVQSQSANSLIHPWVLGSKDENDVQGYAGTPVNVNGLMFDYRFDLEAAGAVLPRAGRYYVAVDSGTDIFTGQSYPGSYVLRSWVNDVQKPTVRLLTTTVAAGRSTLAARVIDTKSGVDPLSLVIGYKGVSVGASAYDRVSGVAVFGLPTAAPALTAAVKPMDATVAASDFQEAKNVNTIGNDIMPNTRFQNVKVKVVARPTLTWVFPQPNECARATERLLVVASSTKTLRSVEFKDAKRRIALKRRGVAGLYDANWNVRRLKKGKHHLTATVRDAAGRVATTRRDVRVCK